MKSYREREINNLVRRANFNTDLYVKEFGLTISNNMMEVRGRVLPPPKLQYGGRVSSLGGQVRISFPYFVGVKLIFVLIHLKLIEKHWYFSFILLLSYKFYLVFDQNVMFLLWCSKHCRTRVYGICVGNNSSWELRSVFGLSHVLRHRGLWEKMRLSKNIIPC